jgi:hypothetical protein
MARAASRHLPFAFGEELLCPLRRGAFLASAQRTRGAWPRARRASGSGGEIGFAAAAARSRWPALPSRSASASGGHIGFAAAEDRTPRSGSRARLKRASGGADGLSAARARTDQTLPPARRASAPAGGLGFSGGRPADAALFVHGELGERPGEGWGSLQAPQREVRQFGIAAKKVAPFLAPQGPARRPGAMGGGGIWGRGGFCDRRGPPGENYGQPRALIRLAERLLPGCQRRWPVPFSASRQFEITSV